MAEFEVTRRLGAHRSEVFDIVSASGRLAEWLSEAPQVEVAGDSLRVALNGDARPLLYDADRAQMRAEWSVAGGGGYAGWLQLADLDGDSCDATVHLSLIDERGGDFGLGAAVEPALERALDRIEGLTRSS